MDVAITTRWNAGRHTRGEEMIQEILDLGLTHAELGYDLRADLIPGVMDQVRTGAVRIRSVHNFCPLPIGAPQPHPELFTFCDPDPRVRESAVTHTTRSIRFAAEVGAETVVIHAGYVDMPRMSDQLVMLCEQGKQFSPQYEKIKLKLQTIRDKKVERQLDYLYAGIEKLLPVLEECNVSISIENLPTWEAIPSEIEMENLLSKFGSKHVRHWHDLGHGQIRQNLGLINDERWIERLLPYTTGFHIHDVIPPARDHVMPPQGKLDFARLKRFLSPTLIKVIEPKPNTPREHLAEAIQYLKTTWEI